MTKCYASVTLALISIWLFACASQPPPELPDPTLNPNQQEIRSLTDRTLLALSSHRYAHLVTLLPPAQQSLPGPEVAALLLGSDHADIALEHWDIHQVPVTFDVESLHASADVTLRYRRGGVNRKPIITRTALHFRREDTSDPWYLDLHLSD